MKEELYEQMEIADLTGDLRDIAELCGIGAAITIMRNFGGVYLNIPKNGHHNFARRWISAHKNYDRKDLALTLDLSLTMVNKILKEIE